MAAPKRAKPFAQLVVEGDGGGAEHLDTQFQFILVDRAQSGAELGAGRLPVFERVADVVGDDLPEFAGVAEQPVVLRRKMQLNALGGAERVVRHAAAHQGAQLETGGARDRAALGETREVEGVVHRRDELLRAGVEGLDQVGGAAAEAFLAQEVEQAGDAVEGIAHLVVDAGEEAVLGLVDLAQVEGDADHLAFQLMQDRGGQLDDGLAVEFVEPQAPTAGDESDVAHGLGAAGLERDDPQVLAIPPASRLADNIVPTREAVDVVQAGPRWRDARLAVRVAIPDLHEIDAEVLAQSAANQIEPDGEIGLAVDDGGERADFFQVGETPAIDPAAQTVGMVGQRARGKQAGGDMAEQHHREAHEGRGRGQELRVPRVDQQQRQRAHGQEKRGAGKRRQPATERDAQLDQLIARHAINHERHVGRRNPQPERGHARRGERIMPDAKKREEIVQARHRDETADRAQCPRPTPELGRGRSHGPRRPRERHDRDAAKRGEREPEQQFKIKRPRLADRGEKRLHQPERRGQGRRRRHRRNGICPGEAPLRAALQGEVQIVQPGDRQERDRDARDAPENRGERHDLDRAQQEPDAAPARHRQTEESAETVQRATRGRGQHEGGGDHVHRAQNQAEDAGRVHEVGGADGIGVGASAKPPCCA